MPIVASLLLRGTLVMVHPCRIQNNVGALDDNSFFSFSHEISLRAPDDLFSSRELTFSEHIFLISLRNSCTNFQYSSFLVVVLEKHSLIMERLNPLATAFSSFFRFGVKMYLLGDLYPT